MNDIKRYMIYGVTGYTGRLLALRAKALGHSPVLAGRNRGAVEQLADQLEFDCTVFDLSDGEGIARGLSHVDAVLHAAGPFVETSGPMVEACLKTGTHYVDITGEIDVFEACAARNAEAIDAGLMLLPGAGFDVVPSDCLAKYVCEAVTTPMHLALAIVGLGQVSRGTAKTGAMAMGRKTRVRRGGRIVEIDKPLKRRFDFAGGPVETVTVSWGDVATAYYSTGVPDVEVYFALTKQLETLTKIPSFAGGLLQLPWLQWFIRARIDKMPPGPSDAEREAGQALILAEVVDSSRNVHSAQLTTPDGYALTVETALKIVENVVGGNFKAGFQTPSLAYGSDFILQFEGVERQDLAG